MKFEQLEKLAILAGRGLLAGFVFGGAAYGMLFLGISLQNSQGLNIGALVSILAGLSGVFMSLKFNGKMFTKT